MHSGCLGVEEHGQTVVSVACTVQDLTLIAFFENDDIFHRQAMDSYAPPAGFCRTVPFPWLAKWLKS